MNEEEEARTVTSEIPVSLDRLALIHKVTLHYMKVKGMFIALIGLTWLVFQSPSRLAGIEWIGGLSSEMVGVIWIVGGLTAVSAGFHSNERLRRLGWFMLIFIPTVMGAYFFISWLLYIIPFESITGYDRGGITTLSYWAFSASAYLMSRISLLSEGVIEEVHG